MLDAKLQEAVAMRQALLRSATALMPVSAAAAAAYGEHRRAMTEEVDGVLASRPDIDRLLNGNPMELFRGNHRNHANFMYNVFLLNEFAIFARILPWVYHAYHAHGVPYDYFPVELAAWRNSVRDHLDPAPAAEVDRIYAWMMDRHDALIRLADFPECPHVAGDERFVVFQQALLHAVLAGEQGRARDVVAQCRNAGATLADLYVQVFQPSLWEVGRLWEEGRVSVAHEHLASAAVARLMAELGPAPVGGRRQRGGAIVTAAPNEFHEIGAWMVADLLADDGWDVRYLGANTPAESLLSLLLELRPKLLFLSVTMPFNLDRAAEVIRLCRQDPALSTIKIVVGGGALRESPELYRKLGADACADNAADAVVTAARLCPGSP
jgi:methanogenic corrinoid protein MtbC1